MVRRLTLVAIAVLTLVGCAVADWSTSPPGVVTDTSRRRVTVQQDSGGTVTHNTSKAVSRRCDVGDRWPDCT